MNTLLFSFKSVTVRNLNKLIFEDLDFCVTKGEHWILAGDSGSGKTALLETIAGNLPVCKGEISHPFFDPMVAEKKLDNPLFTWHNLIASVRSRHHFRNLSNTTNFYYQQRYNSSDSEDAPTVLQILAAVKPGKSDSNWTNNRVIQKLNLQSLLEKQLIKLSNGETKRLLIAAALIKNPVLLLLDNPLAGLDVEMRNYFNQLFSEIANSGVTIIMTGSPNEIPDTITHVALLKKGKIISSAPTPLFQKERITILQDIQIDIPQIRSLLSNHEERKYESIIKMKDVVVRYGETLVLDHINWLVQQGERWALSGPNGAGKSVLLSLINGDNPQAYANDITLFDRKRGSGESIWDIKKKIGFVSPELFQYFPAETSCIHVIESGFYDTLGLFRPSNKAKAEVARRWMKVLEIEAATNEPFKNVSASVQRLCLLARALVKNPCLLLLDEPCQGLDLGQLEHFKHIVELICDYSNATLIYESHYPNEIPSSVKNILKLERGKVIS